MIPVLLVPLASSFAAGIMLFSTAWSDPPSKVKRAHSIDRDRLVLDVSAALLGALLGLVVTGWLVALVVGGLGG